MTAGICAAVFAPAAVNTKYFNNRNCATAPAVLPAALLPAYQQPNISTSYQVSKESASEPAISTAWIFINICIVFTNGLAVNYNI